MKISKSHKRFSEFLNTSRVLESPEEFLGPNYKAVLNFWLSIDDLSKDQWRTIKSRYDDFYNNQRSDWDKVTEEAIKASDETIGELFAGNASYAAHDVYGYAAGWATRELIGMHKLFQKDQSLKIFPLFINRES